MRQLKRQFIVTKNMHMYTGLIFKNHFSCYCWLATYATPVHRTPRCQQTILIAEHPKSCRNQMRRKQTAIVMTE